MKILVLGGTAFVGRAFVEGALARGHELTLVNRGKSHRDLFPGIEQIHLDRGEDLSALKNRKWDVAYDSSGYTPRVVGMSANLLASAVDRYLFISTISVYDEASPGQGEDGRMKVLEDPTVEEVNGATYGGLKVLCEEAVTKAFGDRSLIIRPGFVFGPYDTTDRFPYWPRRMGKGGRVVVPNRPDQPFQSIDTRDLGNWCVELLEQGETGVFNATGPEIPHRLGDVLQACVEGTAAELVWVDPDFLTEQGVRPWIDLPMVLAYDGSEDTMMRFGVKRGVAKGLRFRPLAETVRDTHRWLATVPSDHVWKAGWSIEREAAVLEALDRA